ncbi:hypothetical protein AB4345_05350 [Vibrio breoganii]
MSQDIVASQMQYAKPVNAPEAQASVKTDAPLMDGNSYKEKLKDEHIARTSVDLDMRYCAGNTEKKTYNELVADVQALEASLPKVSMTSRTQAVAMLTLPTQAEWGTPNESAEELAKMFFEPLSAGTNTINPDQWALRVKLLDDMTKLAKAFTKKLPEHNKAVNERTALELEITQLKALAKRQQRHDAELTPAQKAAIAQQAQMEQLMEANKEMAETNKGLMAQMADLVKAMKGDK